MVSFHPPGGGRPSSGAFRPVLGRRRSEIKSAGRGPFGVPAQWRVEPVKLVSISP